MKKQDIESFGKPGFEQRKTAENFQTIQDLTEKLAYYEGKFGKINTKIHNQMLGILTKVENGLIDWEHLIDLKLPKKEGIPKFDEKKDNPIIFFYQVFGQYLDAGITIYFEDYLNKYRYDLSLLHAIEDLKTIENPEILRLLNKYNKSGKIFVIGDKFSIFDLVPQFTNFV